MTQSAAVRECLEPARRPVNNISVTVYLLINNFLNFGPTFNQNVLFANTEQYSYTMSFTSQVGQITRIVCPMSQVKKNKPQVMPQVKTINSQVMTNNSQVNSQVKTNHSQVRTNNSQVVSQDKTNKSQVRTSNSNVLSQVKFPTKLCLILDKHYGKHGLNCLLIFGPKSLMSILSIFQ